MEQLHKIFKLCGSPSEEYWRKSRLPHATIFKPQQPYKRCVSETFKDFPPSALALLDSLLAVEPNNRGSSSSALQSEVHLFPWFGDLYIFMFVWAHLLNILIWNTVLYNKAFSLPSFNFAQVPTKQRVWCQIAGWWNKTVIFISCFFTVCGCFRAGGLFRSSLSISWDRGKVCLYLTLPETLLYEWDFSGYVCLLRYVGVLLSALSSCSHNFFNHFTIFNGFWCH